ncbi:MAG: SRPBCC family protein [Cytophagales bacterium]|nr:SRPBCC family protein [Cytophaga sp.]
MASTNTTITIQANVQVPVAKVWKLWTTPEDILQWNSASSDWHTTKAENDLRVGGKFTSRMEAKDGSVGFDFWGVYDEIITHQKIEYTLGDGRKVVVLFTDNGGETNIVSTFEAENQNSIEMQKYGWLAILISFKTYAEAH